MVCLNDKTRTRHGWNKWRIIIASWIIWHPLKRGSKVWDSLNEKLPEAIGATVQDQPRIEKFKELVKKLSWLDYYRLEEWLADAYYLAQDSMYDVVTGSIEQHFTKMSQIYAEHYNAME